MPALVGPAVRGPNTESVDGAASCVKHAPVREADAESACCGFPLHSPALSLRERVAAQLERRLMAIMGRRCDAKAARMACDEATVCVPAEALVGVRIGLKQEQSASRRDNTARVERAPVALIDEDCG